MTSKLSVYNGALRRLGERRLVSLTEDRAPRRELDECYDEVVRLGLETGFWRFAMKTVKIEQATDIAPVFGYTTVFSRPDDWVRPYLISPNERLAPPLEDYQDEQDYFYADVPELFLRYVSSAPDLGLN